LAPAQKFFAIEQTHIREAQAEQVVEEAPYTAIVQLEPDEAQAAQRPCHQAGGANGES